ncbi:hypothetical protein M3Y95_00266700 [Aphelenchoides besseyi]|nr:hypothetical protein M3Y95_00266700 [Aphelenchoides besseyi]
MNVTWFIILFLLSLANAKNPLENDLVADHLILIATTKRPSAIKNAKNVIQLKLKKCKKNLSCLTWLKSSGCTTKNSFKPKCPTDCSALLCKNRTTTRKPNKPTLKNVQRKMKKTIKMAKRK